MSSQNSYERLEKIISEEQLALLKQDNLATLILISKILNGDPVKDGKDSDVLFLKKVKYLRWENKSYSYDYGVGAMSCHISIRKTKEELYVARLYFGSIDDEDFVLESLEMDIKNANIVYNKLYEVFNRLKFVPSKDELQQISFDTGCFLYR
jgi:hypothetical protein